MWLVRKSKYEAERHLRAKAIEVVKEQSAVIRNLKTEWSIERASLFQEIKRLRDRLAALTEDDPPSRKVLVYV